VKSSIMIQAQSRHAAAMARVKAREEEAKRQHAVAMARRKAKKDVDSHVAIGDEEQRSALVEAQTALALANQKKEEAAFEARVREAALALDEQARLVAQADRDRDDKVNSEVERKVRSEMDKHRMSALLLADDENARHREAHLDRASPVRLTRDLHYQHEDFLARVTVEDLALRYHAEKKAQEAADAEDARAALDAAQEALRAEAEADKAVVQKANEDIARRKADAHGVSLSASTWYTEPVTPPKKAAERGKSPSFEALFVKEADVAMARAEGEAQASATKAFSAFSAFTAAIPPGSGSSPQMADKAGVFWAAEHANAPLGDGVWGKAVGSGSLMAAEATKAVEERQRRLKRSENVG
jgi:hypothetical protein